MYHNAGGGFNILTMPKLWTGIGTVAWDVSSYIHPIIAIIDKYMNLPKGCKLEDFILVGEENRRFWWGWGGWRHQCILSSVTTSLMLGSFSHNFMFMLCRRVLRRVSFVLQKLRVSIDLSCNQFMGMRHIIESTGATKKEKCLFCHQDKVQI